MFINMYLNITNEVALQFLQLAWFHEFYFKTFSILNEKKIYSRVEALKDGLNENSVNIKKVVLSEMNQGGENYCSKIYRARILYGSSKIPFDKELTLIIKSIKITPATQFLQDMTVYLKEKIFYSDVLGKLESYIGDDTKFGAKCLYTIGEPMQTIVFDDLTQYGYQLASRQIGIDEKHCTILLRKLAKFHAASMVLLKKDPPIAKHFNTGMLDENYVRSCKRFTDFIALQLRTLAEVVATWHDNYNDEYEIISKKLHHHCDNIIENLVKTAKRHSDEITVLNHGDLWVNNFMYKYDDQHNKHYPKDVMFLDFQNSFFGSLGCDINFFLNSSVQLKVLMNQRSFLIEQYYETLRKSLIQMHYEPIPSLNDIQKEIHSRELYGFFSSYAFLPLIALKKEYSYDNTIEAFCDKEFAKKKVKLMFSLTTNFRTIDTLKYSLKRFHNLGLFD